MYIYICTFACSFCCQSSCKLLTDCTVALGKYAIEPSIEMQNEKKKKKQQQFLLFKNGVGVILKFDL